MVIETDLLTFFEWLLVGGSDRLPAVLQFLLTAGSLILLALVIGFLAAMVRHGPLVAGDLTYGVVRNAIGELFVLSPRRIWAMARLAIQESLRRRVLVVLAVFVVVLLFAGWFLDNQTHEPVKLYVSFVMTAATYLTLLLAIFLSAFSLPNDFKNRTIYTIVTKPVRSGEIVLGRILGFSAIGTVLLAIMGLASYVFVVRAVSHRHTIVAEENLTSLAINHRHTVQIGPDGAKQTSTEMGHWHPIDSQEKNTEAPQELFRARVPHYGKLRFKGPTGADKARGISVGNEWGYRSYIEGGTEAAAVWTFTGVTADKFPDGLPVELNIRVFRTYKGNIEKGILGSIFLRNPKTGLRSDIETFEARDFHIDSRFLPRKLPRLRKDQQDAGDSEMVDLFDDLVDDQGRVEVWIQCLPRAQYFGAAQADCYLQATDDRFDWNFMKGYLGIWTQMLLVTAFGVMFSTFLSGPVALAATTGALVIGFFADFTTSVATGELEGGGPIESLIRLVTQKNVTSELEQNVATAIVQSIDAVLMIVMQSVTHVLPDFRSFSNVAWVAHGFSIPTDLVCQNLVAALAYVFGVFVGGYFFLRIREVAK